MEHCKPTVFNLFAGEVIGKVDVLGSVVYFRICGQVDGSHVVTVDGVRDPFIEEFLSALKHPERVFADHSECHVFSFTTGGSD